MSAGLPRAHASARGGDGTMTRWTRAVQLLGAIAVLGAGMAGAACGGGGGSGGGGDTPDAGSVGTGPDGGNLTGDAGNLLGNAPNLLSISVSPATASIESLNGATAKQAFSILGHFDNGKTMPLTTGITWSASEPGIGGVDATGLYTASGELGGVVS